MADPITDADILLLALQQAASGPERIETDAGMVRQFSLSELIAAHKYVAAIPVPTATRSSGLRFAQLIPGGTVQRYFRRGHH